MEAKALTYLGADRIKQPAIAASIVVAAVLSGLAGATYEFVALGILIAIPVVAIFLFTLFSSPRVGLILMVAWAFLGLGSSRYLTVVPMGLGIDFLLLLTAFAFFLNRFHDIDWSRLRSPLMAFILLWFVFNILELANPSAPPLEAWFYASRGICLYMIVGVPLAMMLFTKDRDLDSFVGLWFTLSILGALWGIKQVTIGLDSGEQRWLSEPGNFTTHLIFGKLRVFSFYTDAGQFGAAQGHTSVAALILAVGAKNWRKRFLFASVGLLSLYAMVISGTRGALIVPFAGFGAYLLLNRNWKIFLLGLTLMAAAYGFLKFTYIGQDNADIRRLRTALNPDDASFQARLINQRKLADYLDSNPLGGGVGSAGFWGQRFNPDSFLANLALDSWYVRIAAEYGVFGLAFYLVMVLYILISGFFRVNRTRDPAFRQKKAALYAGIVGIAAASYGNQVWGQMPTGIIIYISLAFVFMSPGNEAAGGSGRETVRR